MPKPSFEEQQWYNVTWENKEVHTFHKDICPKVNAIAQPESELVNFEVVVKHFNHYATGAHPDIFLHIVLLNTNNS